MIFPLELLALALSVAAVAVASFSLGIARGVGFKEELALRRAGKPVPTPEELEHKMQDDFNQIEKGTSPRTGEHYELSHAQIDGVVTDMVLYHNKGPATNLAMMQHVKSYETDAEKKVAADLLLTGAITKAPGYKKRHHMSLKEQMAHIVREKRKEKEAETPGVLGDLERIKTQGSSTYGVEFLKKAHKENA